MRCLMAWEMFGGECINLCQFDKATLDCTRVLEMTYICAFDIHGSFKLGFRLSSGQLTSTLAQTNLQKIKKYQA
jgi:hypothetical protein